MEELLGLAELADELLDAEAVEVLLLADGLAAFVDEVDLESRVEEGQFPEPGGEFGELELDGDREDRGIGHEGDGGARLLLVFDLADDVELLGGVAALEGHVVDLAVALDLDLEPVRQGVDALGANPVETARVLVGALPKLAAGMEVGQHQFKGRDAELGVDVDRDAAAVVTDRAGPVDVDDHVDLGAKSGEVFVNRVVEHLEDAVVEPAFVGGSDVHSRPLAHPGEPLELVDL